MQLHFTGHLVIILHMKIAFHTLGCKVNQYETEAMAEIFKSHGHEIVGEEDFADVYVVNTCTVTAMADKKSRQFIRRMKKKNPDSIIAVTGCYVQIDPEAVEAIEGVDIITGINEKGSLPGYVEDLIERREDAKATEKHILDYDDLGSYEDLGTVTSAEGRTRAYIKIEDGCNRFCAYCVIPYARGAVRSRPLEEIVEEAGSLIASGYKEIVLTGINTALYGHDGADGDGGIEPVIAALNDLEGDFRIRLSSLEPTVVDADYVKGLLKYEKLCHHLHLSAQSGSDRILKAMNRRYSRSEYEDIVRVLREFDPCYGISTDIIVGFPEETEDDFEESMSLVRDALFCRTHVFKYSRRPKTRAAEIKDQVPAQIKNDRSDTLQACGNETARRFFEMNSGQTRRVLIEEYLEEEGLFCGYTDNYIRVYIRTETQVEGGGQGPSSLLNAMVPVLLDGPYRDGMLGKVAFAPDLF